MSLDIERGNHRPESPVRWGAVFPRSMSRLMGGLA